MNRLVLLALSAPMWAQTLLHMGTSAPEGSPWHEILLQLNQDWQRVSGGSIRLRIHAGGRLGDEVEMLRKMRIGQLQSVALSGAGLSKADQSVMSLQVPMLIDSYTELDYLRERMEPRIEERMLAKGFVVVSWADAGWVHFFSKRPAKTPSDVKKLKLFTSAGDPDTEKLMKDFGLQPVPSAANEMLPNLQTGFLDAFDAPPLFALLDQSFGIARHMIDLKWSPLIAATVIRKDAWDKIPADMRPKLLEVARSGASAYRQKIRSLGDRAVGEMQKRGLTVHTLSPAERQEWEKEVAVLYPKMRGTLVPADLFDEAVRHRNAYRAKGGGN